MEEEEEINKEEEEGDDEDEEEEEDCKSSAIDDQTTQGSLGEMVEPVENNNSKIVARTLPSTNKRKNFKPRSIVTNDDAEESGPVEDETEEKSVKNRRKRSKTPLRLLKTEVIDLSFKDSREDSDSDVSENSKQTVNLKTYRHIKTKCHFDEKPQNLLSLLNNENNRFNNPFGIDLSKFNKKVAQNSPVDYNDDSDIKNMNNTKNSGNDSCNNQINDVSGPNQVTLQPGKNNFFFKFCLFLSLVYKRDGF